MAAEAMSEPEVGTAFTGEEEVEETTRFCKLVSWEQGLKDGSSHGWHLLGVAEEAIVSEILNFKQTRDIAAFRTWFQQTVLFATVYVRV